MAGLFRTVRTEAQTSALRLNDPELDALLDAADEEVDLEARADLYRQAQELLARSMRTFTLYSLDGILFHADRISDIEFNRDGSLQFTELAAE